MVYGRCINDLPMFFKPIVVSNNTSYPLSPVVNIVGYLVLRVLTDGLVSLR